jgi:uncharacterized protein YndB with AHSA1/START domain
MENVVRSHDRETVERQVVLPADLDEAWDLLTRPEELGAWLGDEVVLDPTPGANGTVLERDGTRRHLVVDDVEVGRRIAWRWWTEDPQRDGDRPARDESQVEITLVPTEGGTLVRVVEELGPQPTPARQAEARASTSAAWSHRLLHLEALLLVAAAVRG